MDDAVVIVKTNMADRKKRLQDLEEFCILFSGSVFVIHYTTVI